MSEWELLCLRITRKTGDWILCKLYIAFIRRKKREKMGEALHMKAICFQWSYHFIDPTAVLTVSVLMPEQKSTKTFFASFDCATWFLLASADKWTVCCLVGVFAHSSPHIFALARSLVSAKDLPGNSTCSCSANASFFSYLIFRE